jgi:RNA polymerase sigma factor (sigma-70 family)
MNPPDPAIGDVRDSLERSLDSYRAYLLFVAWRIKGDELAGVEGASDLVQRTLFAALEKIRDGRVPGESERQRKAWLRRILCNTFRTEVRRARSAKNGGGRVVGLEDSAPDSTTSPSGKVERREQESLLAEAFDRLAPDERELITWRFVDGLSCEEIGRRRGYSASYASRACNEIIGRLRRSVGS